MGKRLRGVIVVLLLFFTGVSLASGLEFSASTGGNLGSSSTNVRYGATIEIIITSIYS